MGKMIVLPLKIHIELPVDLSTDVLFPATDITLPVPAGTVVEPPTISYEPPAAPPPPPPPGVTVANPPIGLTAWDEDAGKLIAYSIGALLGLPPAHYETVIVFAVQAHHEDAGGDASRSQGALYNNPLNLTDANGTITWPGQVGRYLDQFAIFTTLQDGAKACAMNYVNGMAYAAVIDAFKANDYLRMAQAIQDSPWDAGHYGGNLVNEVRAALGI